MAFNNASVTGFCDRWTQAKRHMWGIEETAWVLSLFSVIRFRVWSKLLKMAAGSLLTTNVVALASDFNPNARFLLIGLSQLTLKLMLGALAAAFIYGWPLGKIIS